MSQVQLKELLVSNWREYKAIRLQSLRDSPDAFGSTYESAAILTSDQWKSRLNVIPNSPDRLTIVATSEESCVGLVFSVRESTYGSSANLYQMWVDPEFRGAGVGTALIDSVKKWAAEKGIDKLLLDVTTTNTEAMSLYLSAGFKPAGINEPLREGSELCVQPMELDLNASIRGM